LEAIMSRSTFIVLGLAACFGVAEAQQVATRRASIIGRGGDEGKCTVEVRVDGAAEVEVNGDMGRIRNLNGTGAQWVRFECNQPLPRNPVDFRFKGIDGRGSQRLVRDPQSTRGAAVVLIEDPKGGSEGYTFDLIWRGGYDGGNYGRDGAYQRDRDYRDGDDRNNNGRYNNDRNPGNNGRGNGYGRGGRFGNNNNRDVVTCASNDGRRSFCEVDTRNGVMLMREHSDRRCREGSTWGFDRRGIWVDRGCRADFEVRDR
jgi:hypothetical protein